MIGVVGVAAVIAASIAAGIVAEPRLADGGRGIARRLTRALLWVVAPFIYFFVVARLELTAGVGVGIVLSYAALGIVTGIAWLVATRWLRLSRPATGAFVVAVLIANTGYVGLPLTGAALGSGQLGYAIAYDSAVNAPLFVVVAMSIGAVMGSEAAAPRRDLALALLRNPLLIAVVLGLIAPDALAPDLLVDVAQVLVYAMVPLAFFVVGLSLGAESEEGALTFPPALTAPVAGVLALRLVVAPLLLLGLSAAFIDVPDAYLLQAAMPCGVNSVLVAHLYGLDQRIAASAVAWSTMIVLVVAVAVSPLL
ncbi:MAG TPA: AEC family transporter [Capillimicrobium sp.]|nr:AEC family transporter [Capillimicrobium sp.]